MTKKRLGYEPKVELPDVVHMSERHVHINKFKHIGSGQPMTLAQHQEYLANEDLFPACYGRRIKTYKEKMMSPKTKLSGISNISALQKQFS